jgi:hypothetical protein
LTPIGVFISHVEHIKAGLLTFEPQLEYFYAMKPGLASTNCEVSKPGEAPQKERTYTVKQYGVWEVLFMDEGYLEAYQRLIHDTPKSLPSLYRLIRDIFSLSPTLFVVFVCCQLWGGSQEAVKMHFSNKALSVVSTFPASWFLFNS